MSQLTEQFAKIKTEDKPKEDVLKKGQDPKSRKVYFNEVDGDWVLGLLC